MDFTDINKPHEIAYFDRGPLDEKVLILGGPWSTYWYNGYIYSSEIARGLDILELTPTPFLTQNEIDAAKTVIVPELNVQDQKRIIYPNKLVVAKAYIDQLERSKSISDKQVAKIRQAIKKAEESKMSKKAVKNLKKHAKSLKKASKKAKSSTDSARILALSKALKKPVA